MGMALGSVSDNADAPRLDEFGVDVFGVVNGSHERKIGREKVLSRTN